MTWASWTQSIESVTLLNFSYKLKQTDDQINKVQERIEQLNREREAINGNQYNLAVHYKNREIGLGRSPFANFGVFYDISDKRQDNFVKSGTSNQQYGKYQDYQQFPNSYGRK